MIRGVDPRDEPIYSISSAAWCLARPTSTVRSWVVGASIAHRRLAAPIVRIAKREPPTLSFWNLVEVYVLSGIRKEHGVSMQKVRRALGYVEKHLDSKRPLIEQDFLTNGVDLFVDKFSELINVSGDGQLALRELLVGSLKRIDRDPNGLATRVSPWRKSPEEPREVEIDPTRSFGRRVLVGTSIPTEIIGERFRGGDSIESLGRDYRLTPAQIEAALRWEQCAAVQ